MTPDKKENPANRELRQ